MKTAEIELAVAYYFGTRSNLIVPNVYWGFAGLDYEADLIVVRPSGYAIEVEIKVSKSDLIKDKEKLHGHSFYKFKELYFAIPGKLIPYIEHIPERAGILLCSSQIIEDIPYYSATLLREAVTNKAEPLSEKNISELARLGTMRIWNLKKKLLELERTKLVKQNEKEL